MHYSKRGFTLIELIIVIVIIGILAAIAAPIMQGAKAKAIATEAVTGLSVLYNALQQYYVENGKYPRDTGICFVDLYPPGYFPGLSMRPHGSSYGGSSLDGYYFSQECYQYVLDGNQHPVVVMYVNVNGDYLRNLAPGASEAAATTDSPPDAGYFEGQFPCITKFFDNKKFMHHGWSKTGLPCSD